MPAEPLSYQRLLEITGKLSGDEQAYVMRFLSSNDRKTRAKVAELERERKSYTDLSVHLKAARDEVEKLKNSNQRLTDEANQVRQAFDEHRKKVHDERMQKQEIGKQRRYEMIGLEHLVRRLLTEPTLVHEDMVKERMVTLADRLTTTLSQLAEPSQN